MAVSGSDDSPGQHPRGRCLEGTDDPDDTMPAGRAEHSLEPLRGKKGDALIFLFGGDKCVPFLRPILLKNTARNR